MYACTVVDSTYNRLGTIGHCHCHHRSTALFSLPLLSWSWQSDLKMVKDVLHLNNWASECDGWCVVTFSWVEHSTGLLSTYSTASALPILLQRTRLTEIVFTPASQVQVSKRCISWQFLLTLWLLGSWSVLCRCSRQMEGLHRCC